MAHGIAGQQAPELTVPYWIDAAGQQRAPMTLRELGPRYRVLFFYQHWCDGCHSYGFPTLCSLISKLNSEDVGFAAIQTAFEGTYVNMIDKLQVDRQRYGLSIPFGHEGRSVFGEHPTTMDNFRTAGTPWFVAIAPSRPRTARWFHDPRRRIRRIDRWQPIRRPDISEYEDCGQEYLGNRAARRNTQAIRTRSMKHHQCSWEAEMVGFDAKNKLPQESCDQPATTPSSAMTVVVAPCEDDYEDGDFATPKYDRNGTDDEPL